MTAGPSPEDWAVSVRVFLSQAYPTPVVDSVMCSAQQDFNGYSPAEMIAAGFGAVVEAWAQELAEA